MKNHVNTITTYDFHSYLDNQLSEADFSELETRLGKAPGVVLRLQQCLMINEGIQAQFGELIQEPLPGYANAGKNNATKSTPDPEPEFLDPMYADGYEDAAEDDAMDIRISVDAKPERIQRPRSESKVESKARPRQEKPPRNKERQPVNAANDNDMGNIDVETLMKGISEVDLVLDGHEDRMIAPARYSMELYTEPDTGWLRLWLRNLFDQIHTRIFIFRVRLAHRFKRDPEPPKKRAYTQEDLHDFDIDIDRAIEDTSKWRFLKDHVSNATDEALSSVREHLEPIKPRVPWLVALYARIQGHSEATDSGATTVTADRRHYWLASGGLLFGIAISMLWSGVPNLQDKPILHRFAIDSHLFYSDKGYSAVAAGNPNFSDSLIWLHQKTGQRQPLFNVNESNFQQTGGSLIPGPTGYSSIHIFENKKHQRMSLVVTPWDTTDSNTTINCEVPTTGLDGLCSWQKNSLLFILVADLSLSRVREFAEFLEVQTK